MQDCLFLPSVQLHQRNTSLVFANNKKTLKKKGTKIQVSEVQMSPACRGNCAPFTFAMHLCCQLILLCLSNVIYVKPLSWTYCFVLWSPHFSKVSCQSFLTRLIHDPVRTPPHPVGLFAACHFLISLFLSHWADEMSVSRIESCLSFAPKSLLNLNADCWCSKPTTLQALRTDRSCTSHLIISSHRARPIHQTPFIHYFLSSYLVRVLLPASAAPWKWGRLHGNMSSHPWLARGWSGITTAHFDRATERKRNRKRNLSNLLNIN